MSTYLEQTATMHSLQGCACLYFASLSTRPMGFTAQMPRSFRFCSTTPTTSNTSFPSRPDRADPGFSSRGSPRSIAPRVGGSGESIGRSKPDPARGRRIDEPLLIEGRVRAGITVRSSVGPHRKESGPVVGHRLGALDSPLAAEPRDELAQLGARCGPVGHPARLAILHRLPGLACQAADSSTEPPLASFTLVRGASVWSAPRLFATLRLAAKEAPDEEPTRIQYAGISDPRPSCLACSSTALRSKRLCGA